jgi:protocatechuate 3,4-dioxygenase beta subunit
MTEGQSEADGRFTLAGLYEGSYRVTARASGYAQATRSGATGGEPIEIVLAPGGTITGQVVDESNRPVDNFSVDADPTSRPDGRFVFRGGSERVVDPDGRFTLDSLAENTYVVRAESPEMVAASVSGVKVTAGQTVDVGRIRLTRGGLVRGMVVDSTGAPIAGANVSVRGAGNDMIFRGDGGTVPSDGGGIFEVRGVPLGRADVIATHSNYAAGRITVEVEAGKTADARVVLSQGGRIEGYARKRDGTPLPGRVQVTPLQMGGIDMASRPALAPVAADGSFVVEHVAPGRVRVLLMQGTPSQMMSVMSKEAEVREGEATAVELSSREILVTGRVTRSGVPQPGLRVTMRIQGGAVMVMSMSGPLSAPPPTSGPQRGLGRTREDGSYELLLDDAGEAMVRVETPDGKQALLNRQEAIPDADSHNLDLALTGVTLTGMVVDKLTEKGVAEARVSASPKKGSGPGTSAESGPDGRFTMDVEPGELRLRASASGYAEGALEVSVGQSGLNDVRVDLSKGLAIEGKVLDPQGRPVPGIVLMATSAGPREGRSSRMSLGLADGSFRLEGLPAKPHSLLAGNARDGFAFRALVSPGAKDIALTLQPGGKVRARVVGPDGQPAERVMVALESVGGVPASLPMSSAVSDAQGLAELELPAGPIELFARKGELRATRTVTLATGGMAAVELALKAEPPPKD